MSQVIPIYIIIDVELLSFLVSFRYFLCINYCPLLRGGSY